MKKLFFMLLVFFTGTNFIFAQAGPGGEEIANMVVNAGKLVKGIAGKGVMEIVDLQTKTKDPRAFIIMITFGSDEIKSIFRFTDPKLNMATFYNAEKKGQEPVILMYFNTYKQPLQIRAQQKENNFLYTDISMEDLGNIKAEDYTYKRLEDKTITVDGKKRDCYMIERYPKTKSQYSKHVVLVDKEWLLPVIYKSYNTSDRIVKNFTAGDIRKIANKIYMPFSLKIVNVEKKHETNVKFNSIEEKTVDINVNMITQKWAE